MSTLTQQTLETSYLLVLVILLVWIQSILTASDLHCIDALRGRIIVKTFSSGSPSYLIGYKFEY